MQQRPADGREHSKSCQNWTKNKKNKKKGKGGDKETQMMNTHTLLMVIAPNIEAPPALWGPPCGPFKQMMKKLNIEKNQVTSHITYISLSYIWFATKENKKDLKNKNKK